jgi:hypothetical protein
MFLPESNKLIKKYCDLSLKLLISEQKQILPRKQPVCHHHLPQLVLVQQFGTQ